MAAQNKDQITMHVTADDAVKALAKHGVEISENEANLILDFLYFMCKLTVNQHVNNSKFIDLAQEKTQGKSIKRQAKINKK
jgi:acyl-ACP thioesterase